MLYEDRIADLGKLLKDEHGGRMNHRVNKVGQMCVDTNAISKNLAY